MHAKSNGLGSGPSVEANVIGAIAATCHIDAAQVRGDMAIDDLGLGSMGLVAVISRLEALYQLEIGSEHVVSLLQAAVVGEFADQFSRLIQGHSVEK